MMGHNKNDSWRFLQCGSEPLEMVARYATTA